MMNMSSAIRQVLDEAIEANDKELVLKYGETQTKVFKDISKMTSDAMCQGYFTMNVNGVDRYFEFNYETLEIKERRI